MANFYSDNAQLSQDVPSTKSKPNEDKGKLRVLHDEITFTAQLTTADVLKMGKIPAGAKIYEVEINTEDLGVTGILDVGWAASADGGEAADADGFYAALDVKAAANSRLKYVGTVGGFQKEFSEEVEIEIVPSESTDIAIGQFLKLTIFYSLD